ncbi:MAG TPA: hypothetical protein VFJ13_07310 [Paracoccaceae bacterium]|nr:hypothetical protein [Paracoccaceae bacterium]
MKLAGLNIIALLLSGLVLSGCAAVAAGTAGGVAADELTEDDDQFDPLEDTELGEEVYD